MANALFKAAPPPAPREAGQPWRMIDAARYLGVSVSTLKRAEKIGTLRCVRHGNRVFIADDEVRRLLREGVKTVAA